eukprot:sb/3478654/
MEDIFDLACIQEPQQANGEEGEYCILKAMTTALYLYEANKISCGGSRSALPHILSHPYINPAGSNRCTARSNNLHWSIGLCTAVSLCLDRRPPSDRFV